MKKLLDYLSFVLGAVFLGIIIYENCFNRAPKPHAGEIWRVEKPFQAEVIIDSINQFGNLCFHDMDSLRQRGICYLGYFEGEKIGEVKPIR